MLCSYKGQKVGVVSHEGPKKFEAWKLDTYIGSYPSLLAAQLAIEKPYMEAPHV